MASARAAVRRQQHNGTTPPVPRALAAPIPTFPRSIEAVSFRHGAHRVLLTDCAPVEARAIADGQVSEVRRVWDRTKSQLAPRRGFKTELQPARPL